MDTCQLFSLESSYCISERQTTQIKVVESNKILNTLARNYLHMKYEGFYVLKQSDRYSTTVNTM